MKRFSIVLVILLVVSSVGLFAHAPYDSAIGVPVMRANGAAFGQLRAAQSDGDFLAAAGALAVMAEGSIILLDLAAPQGSQEEWERIHNELVMTALRGIQACSEEDAEVLAEVVGLMGGFSQQGHGQFR